MTITDSIDRPTRRIATLDEIRAHLAATGRLCREDLIIHMRLAGRGELIHYAGAAHRDETAWRVSLAWLEDPTRTESECKAIALKGTPYEVTAEDVRQLDARLEIEREQLLPG